MEESTPHKEELKLKPEGDLAITILQKEQGIAPKPASKSQEQKPLENLQLFTTAGYLALLVIGITKEVLKYAILDINILPYYSITDIVLSPLDILRQYWIIVLTPLFLLFWIDAFRGTAKNMQQKAKYYQGRKKRWIDWWAKLKMNWGFLWVFYASFVLGIAFQSAVMNANKLQEALTTNTLEMTHELIFRDQEKLKVAIVGQSSEFIFYVEEGQQEISISPINGNIKKWVPLTLEPE